MIYLTKYMIQDYLERRGVTVKICGKEPWRLFDASVYGEADYRTADCRAADCRTADCHAAERNAAERNTADYCATDHYAADHCAADHCAADHYAVNHCTANHCAANHCAANHCAANHCAANHCAADHAVWDHELLHFIRRNNTKFSYVTAPVCLARAVSSETFADYNSEHEEIICCGTDNEVIELLLSCFNFYKNWYLSLQECLIKGGKLQTLVTSSLHVFCNPIAVSDIGFQVLAYTKEYHSQMDDDESRFIVKHGCHSPEYIHHITHHTAFLDNLKNNMGPFRYHYEFLQHESIYCTIWVHAKPVGFLTVVGMNPLQSRYFLDVTHIFSQVLSQAFQKNAVEPIPLSSGERVLLRIMKGELPGITDIADVLTDTRLEANGTYTILTVNMPEICPHQNMLLQKVCDSLSKSLPRSRLLPDDDGITILLSGRDMSPDRIVLSVDCLLSSYSHQIGISYSFQGLKTLDLYYRQAKACVYFQTIHPEEHIFTYESYGIYDVLQNPLTLQQKKAAIHPALPLLMEGADTGSLSCLFLTLKAYLDSNLNGTTAAQTLHIHKNTLYYRLKQIEDLTGLTFDDSRLCDCLRLSFYLWETVCA